MSRARVVLAAGAALVALGVLWLLGFVAPTRAEDRAARAGALLGVPALAALDGVALGMSPRALRRVRPVEPAPYVGLAETVGDARVRYQFGRVGSLGTLWMDDSGAVPPWLRLESVDAWVERPSTAAADSLWADGARHLVASARSEVRCFAYRHGLTPSVAAVHEADGRAVGVVRYPQREERDVRGPLTIPASVRTFVARDAALVVPETAWRTPIACPATP